jgi:hypothetical protein
LNTPPAARLPHGVVFGYPALRNVEWFAKRVDRGAQRDAAIAEMIAALMECFVHLLIALAELAAALVAMAIEFIFLAITKGASAASDRFKQRRQALAQRRKRGRTIRPTAPPPAGLRQ